MKSFLSLVAEDLFRVTGGNLKDLTVVFPNRRSGWTLRQELHKLVSKPAWSPAIESIDDWLVRLSGLHVTDPLGELASLYQVVRMHLPNLDSFTLFLDLGEAILKDFDDVDKYLADPAKVFQAVNELRKIGEIYDLSQDEELAARIRIFWTSFGIPSAHQKNWLSLWEKLYPIYYDFEKDLNKRGLGTAGMCYRKSAALFASGTTPYNRGRKIAFAGFNILTKAEEEIFTILRDTGNALFYWDYHPFYMNRVHEAGRFVYGYRESFPAPSTFEPVPASSDDLFAGSGSAENRLNVSPLTSNSGQIQALVSSLSNKKNGRTGIVLSDESLLPDLISAWPEEAGAVNYTSGYPVGSTQAASFIRLFLSLVEDSIQAKNGSPEIGHPESEWLSNLAEHPWSRSIEVSGSLSNLDSAGSVAGRIRYLAAQLTNGVTGITRIEQEALKTIAEQAGRIIKTLQKHRVDPGIQGFNKLLTRQIPLLRITLETKREAEKQVLGVLETRLLDFDRVYILSCNEGIWPSRILSASLIPYSLRKYFRLPTAENRDAMYAYYFYRLIQRASEVNLYYLAGHRDDKIRSGEMSRYISQLKYDAPVKVDELFEPPIVITPRRSPPVIEKDKKVMIRLKRFTGKFAEKSLSASVLNDYLDCRLRFAFQNVFDLAEPEEPSTAAEPRGFGNLLHNVMESLYSPYIGKTSGPGRDWYDALADDPNFLKSLIRSANAKVTKGLGQVDPVGKDMLALSVAEEYIRAALKVDAARPPGQIIGIEKNLRGFYPVCLGGREKYAAVKARIDRIDESDEIIRIIDYKTGSCELDFSSVASLYERENNSRRKEIFQLLFYSEMYCRFKKPGAVVVPEIWRFVRFRAGENSIGIRYNDSDLFYSEVKKEFNDNLIQLLTEIFDPNVPFKPAKNEAVCRYCQFAGLCGRD